MGLSMKTFHRWRGAAVLFLLIGLSLASCTTTQKVLSVKRSIETSMAKADAPSKKEIRQDNRAARKLDKFTAKNPRLLRQDTTIINIAMRTPVIQSRIISMPSVPLIRERIIEIPGAPIPSESQEWLPIYFEDDTLAAKISFGPDGTVSLDYTVKPLEVDTTIQHIDTKIQATEHNRLPQRWWQLVLQCFGMLFICCLAIWLALQTLKR